MSEPKTAPTFPGLELQRYTGPNFWQQLGIYMTSKSGSNSHLFCSYFRDFPCQYHCCQVADFTATFLKSSGFLEQVAEGIWGRNVAKK